MRNRFWSITVTLALVAAAMVWSTGAEAAKRVALVVGNSQYKSVPYLANPSNDAALIGQKLTELGFEVLTFNDLDFTGFTRALRIFETSLDDAEAAVFYYAGHGMQYKKENYLLAVDANISDEQDVVVSGKNLADIVSLMENSVPLSLAFIDACRDNPFANTLMVKLRSKSRAIGLDRGLAPIASPTTNTLIAFATRPGGVASDGAEKNSPFAMALAKHIAEPNVEVSTMLKRVTKDVGIATEQKQRPEIVSSMDAEFYFFPMVANPATLSTEGIDAQRELSATVALNQATATGTIAAYRLVIEKFPGTKASDAADQILKYKLSAAIEQQSKSAQNNRTSELAVSTDALLAKLDQAQSSAPETSTELSFRPETVESSLALGLDGYKKVQDALKMLGYDAGVSDGVFATKSRDALRQFQIASKNEGTGYIDQRALLSLIRTFEETPKSYDGLWDLDVHRYNPKPADPNDINSRTLLAQLQLRVTSGDMTVVSTENAATQRQLFAGFKGNLLESGEVRLSFDIDYLFGKTDRIRSIEIKGSIPKYVAFGGIVKLPGPRVERSGPQEEIWIRAELTRRKP